MKRQVPQWSALASLMRFRRPIWSPQRRRLSRAQTVADLRELARRRTPRAAFDYTDGAADTESSLTRARAAFAAVEFRPAVLRDVARADASRRILRQPARLPLIIAPTGFTRLMRADGEIAGATVAAERQIPFTLSTLGTSSIEQIAAAAPAGQNWFQLYLWKDRERSMALVDRAAAAGVTTLVVTVDVPVAGQRLRDVRNGMTIPPTLTPRTILDAARHPAWWFDFLTTEPLSFASLGAWPGTVAELIDTMFDPTVTLEDLAWIRQQWKGQLVVKGVQSVADAAAVARIGADGVVLSNHGGRQLDRAPVPFRLLPQVVAEVGSDVEVFVDTGVMSGYDIVASVAHGARAVLIGRAWLYGLMAGGSDGVRRMLDILTAETERTMRLLGVTSLDELTPEHVAVRPR